MPTNIYSDQSKRVDWYVRKNTDVSILLEFVAYDMDDLTLSCGVYRNNVLVASPTLVKGASDLTISLTNTQLSIDGDEYFWSLSTTTPINMTILQGVFQVNNFLWPEEGNASNSVVVNIDGVDVTINISNQ